MTRKQIKELLEKLNDELKIEIETSQASLKDARSITTKINNLFAKATGIIAKLEDPDLGVDAKLQQGANGIQSISDFVSAIAASAQVVDGHLQDIQQNITTMEAAYASFQGARSRFDDPSTGLEALLITARQLKGQVQASATQASNLESKIQQNLAAVQQSISAMQSAYVDFQAIQARIDDPDSGLEAILDGAQSLKDDLVAISKDGQTIYSEITRYKDQAAKNAASIQAIKDESDTTLTQIKRHETESENTKNRIAEIFELVSQSGHANYFDERRKKLVSASWLWLLTATGALGVAVWMACGLLIPIVDISAKGGNGMREIEIGMLILRASIITPVVAFSIFAFSNYGKERRLAEQYAFKAVSASTIEGSIALIERSLKSVPSEHLNTQLADFAIKTAHSLHAEPSELQKTSRFSFNAGNKIMSVGAEINDTLENIGKDIKEVANQAKKVDAE